jgi:ATP-dependent helicase/nuclease subunit A
MTSQHVAIRASAGSGKTYRLTTRYLGLLLRGESPSHILATTFTRKAAGEILGRVLTRLAGAVLEARACETLAKDVGQPDLTMARAGETLKEAASLLHRMRISTIDSFFAGIAKSFSLELAFPPQWEIVDASVADAMRTEAVSATLRGEVDAVLVLIRLLSKGRFGRSVASLVAETVDALHGVYLDAPDSAWDTLVSRTVPDLAWREEIVRQLEDCQVSLALPGRMAESLQQTIEHARARRWEMLLTRGLPSKLLNGKHTYYSDEIPPEIEDHLAELIEQVRAVLLDALIGRGRATHRLLAVFDEHVRELKRARAALRFDDVTRALATASLLGRLDEVFFRLDGSIHHLLLDEFQDTSLAQWQVLRPLAKEVASHATPDRSVLLVGDVKQAIYGWRGGVADIFDTLDADLPGLTWEPLHMSRRSSPPIIDTVNYVFEDLRGNKALRDEQAAAYAWQAGYVRHKTIKKDLAGYARLEVAPSLDGESAGTSTLRRAAIVTKEWARRCPGASIGVLTRSNDAVRRVMAELRELRVPASEEGGNPITDSAAVGLVLSLLRMADHPGDSVARFHVAASPLGESLGLKNNAASAARVARDVREQLQRDGYATSVLGWASVLAPHCDEREARRLTQLLRLASSHDDRPGLRADDFVAYASTERVEDPATADVRVMTIHKSKGLQFDVVILPELDEKLVGRTPAVLVESPSPMSPPTKVVPYANEAERLVIPELREMAKRWRAGQVRESLSLLYVALTRAVHALVMVIEPNDRSDCPPTFAGLLRHALAQGAMASASAVLFERGDDRWDERHSFVRSAPEGERKAISQVRMRASGGRARGFPRTSPSALEGGTQLQVADIMRLDTRSLRTGSVVHALFEQVGWLEDGVASDEVLREVARAAGAPADRAASLVAEFRVMLDQPQVRDVLRRSSYVTEELAVEVHRELPFALRDDKRLLTGAMDRVAVRRFGDLVHDVEVLDYKTDGVDETTLPGKVEHYRPQLEAYGRAAARLFGAKPENVRARLVFVRAGWVVDVRREVCPPFVVTR